jgi:hypothetical protein
MNIGTPRLAALWASYALFVKAATLLDAPTCDDRHSCPVASQYSGATHAITAPLVCL